MEQSNCCSQLIWNVLGFKEKNMWHQFKLHFKAETNLSVIENKSVHRNCEPDSYLHCTPFAPLQQCERSWSMTQLFLYSHEGPVY